MNVAKTCKNLIRIRALIASDSIAISQQSMANYRTMLLKAIDTMLESEEIENKKQK